MRGYTVNPVPRGHGVSITFTFGDRPDIHAKIWDGGCSINEFGQGLPVGSDNYKDVHRIVYTISVLFFGNTPNRKV